MITFDPINPPDVSRYINAGIEANNSFQNAGQSLSDTLNKVISDNKINRTNKAISSLRGSTLDTIEDDFYNIINKGVTDLDLPLLNKAFDAQVGSLQQRKTFNNNIEDRLINNANNEIKNKQSTSLFNQNSIINNLKIANDKINSKQSADLFNQNSAINNLKINEAKQSASDNQAISDVGIAYRILRQSNDETTSKNLLRKQFINLDGSVFAAGLSEGLAATGDANTGKVESSSNRKKSFNADSNSDKLGKFNTAFITNLVKTSLLNPKANTDLDEQEEIRKIHADAISNGIPQDVNELLITSSMEDSRLNKEVYNELASGYKRFSALKSKDIIGKNGELIQAGKPRTPREILEAISSLRGLENLTNQVAPQNFSNFGNAL